MAARFFVPDLVPQPGAQVSLPPAAAHHALRVLRLRVGEPVVVFDGRGGEWRGVLAAVGRDAAWVRLEAFDPVSRELPFAVTVGQALLPAERMDWAIQKAVELGAARIVPLLTARTQTGGALERGARKQAHWQQVALAAAQQCGRTLVPEVELPRRWREWVEEARGARFWLLAPGGVSLSRLSAPERSVTVLVGPEGGWSEEELDEAERIGVERIGLGPRILRSETAAAAALAMMQVLWGER
ncbi:MAG: 16S rRNA (uracil(1498)-N(3))-methyltransferase [Rhodocyclales bacterium]|nr:16S rRNA (uracil(1498)-N(3))-methyltransferase [Rhodocyclales bacterium]